MVSLAGAGRLHRQVHRGILRQDPALKGDAKGVSLPTSAAVRKTLSQRHQETPTTHDYSSVGHSPHGEVHEVRPGHRVTKVQYQAGRAPARFRPR